MPAKRRSDDWGNGAEDDNYSITIRGAVFWGAPETFCQMRSRWRDMSLHGGWSVARRRWDATVGGLADRHVEGISPRNSIPSLSASRRAPPC